MCQLFAQWRSAPRIGRQPNDGPTGNWSPRLVSDGTVPATGDWPASAPARVVPRRLMLSRVGARSPGPAARAATLV